jgi:hypothetical protein
MRRRINRRSILKTGTLALSSLAVRSMGLPAQSPPGLGNGPRQAAMGFKHCGYLGWITDLASDPDIHAAWPSMRLDERLLRDYRQSFELMRSLGFNEISIWGLYVSRPWLVDIKSAVSRERGAMVEKLVDDAHRRGIRVYSGLGVYSWGFEDIIKAHPELSRGNPRALCASEPASWEWMRKVIDFVFTRFPIDGVSMQSADQGRCACHQCSAYTDAEYHALLNVRVSDYIRGRWPKKTIGVNSWGMKFEEPETLPSLVKISQKVDYLIDVHDTSRKRQPDYRRKVIQSLACDFGTLGGPQVEPPQHWERGRWFLPTLRRVGEHLQELAHEGGKACEYFFHILANPGDELSFWLAGKVLSDPAKPWDRHLLSSVEELYHVPKSSTRDALAQFFLRSEEAYFKYLPRGVCGTISLEPLVSDSPGPPVYLSERLSSAQRGSYAGKLKEIKIQAEKLLPDVPQKDRMKSVIGCLDNMLKDLAT